MDGGAWWAAVHGVAKSRTRLSNFTVHWTVAYQAPLSMDFISQEYWNGLLFPPPGDLPNPGMEPQPLVSPAVAGWFFTTAPAERPSELHVKFLAPHFPYSCATLPSSLSAFRICSICSRPSTQVDVVMKNAKRGVFRQSDEQ